MLFSMTGYGKSSATVSNKIIRVEVKSLNSKSFDLYSKIPNQYKSLESDFRTIISEHLKRGKIDFSLSVEAIQGAALMSKINQNLALGYFEELKGLNTSIQQENVDFLSIIMRIPGVLTTNEDEIGEEEQNFIKKLIVESCETVNQFRQQEGSALEKDFTTYIEHIRSLLKKVEPFEKERIETIKSRLTTSLSEIGNYDENRYHQELIYYMEKLDISEEKMRLANHLSYFLKTMKEVNECGKKLGFIAQEIGREINTLGSKSNHVEIQKIVVNMKDTLEKIKEQVLNTL